MARRFLLIRRPLLPLELPLLTQALLYRSLVIIVHHTNSFLPRDPRLAEEQPLEVAPRELLRVEELVERQVEVIVREKFIGDLTSSMKLRSGGGGVSAVTAKVAMCAMRVTKPHRRARDLGRLVSRVAAKRREAVIHLRVARRVLVVERHGVQFNKLAQLDLAVLVALVDGIDELIELLLGRVLTEAAQHHAKLLRVDRTAAVAVHVKKHFPRGLELLVLRATRERARTTA